MLKLGWEIARPRELLLKGRSIIYLWSSSPWEIRVKGEVIPPEYKHPDGMSYQDLVPIPLGAMREEVTAELRKTYAHTPIRFDGDA